MAHTSRKFSGLLKSYLNNDYLVKRNVSQSMSEAISMAEVVLGYSIKDLSVKQIVNNTKIELLYDKTSNLNDEHPVLLAQRKLDPDIEVNFKSRALLTLLLAKVVEVPKTLPQFKFNLDFHKSDFLTKQLLLAETIELIHGGCLFHTIGISPINQINNYKNKLILQGNRLAILRGDSMFSFATKNLVKIKNSKVTELMSTSLREFVEGEYLNIKIKQKIESGDWHQILDNWVQMTFLKYASLIANGCQSMIHLSGNCQSIEANIYKFGNNVGFAWRLLEELHEFLEFQNNSNNVLVNDTTLSLPILLHLNSNLELKNQMNETDKINFFKNITNEVHKSHAIEKTKSLLEFYVNNAITQLNYFADSDAKTALNNMITALKVD